MLFELIYASTSTHNQDDRPVEDILQVARRNNSVKSITGLLLFNGTRYCQLLEGDKTAVEETFERIKEDKRHKDVSLYHSGKIGERSFGDWAMSYQRIDKQLVMDGRLTWLEGQVLVNDTSQNDTIGRRILRLINNLSS